MGQVESPVHHLTKADPVVLIKSSLEGGKKLGPIDHSFNSSLNRDSTCLSNNRVWKRKVRASNLGSVEEILVPDSQKDGEGSNSGSWRGRYQSETCEKDKPFMAGNILATPSMGKVGATAVGSIVIPERPLDESCKMRVGAKSSGKISSLLKRKDLAYDLIRNKVGEKDSVVPKKKETTVSGCKSTNH
ncbi:hypothetical protein LWI29_024449 [Acer saccharum]|uniref:Uncharacterized protein n=1 Tax=Acer saccharum TaxID=4024 RepID=A0AA39VJB8_ACESA|nr:hypothetical protein LWI29_024449 [Acer saccharum]